MTNEEREKFEEIAEKGRERVVQGKSLAPQHVAAVQYLILDALAPKSSKPVQKRVAKGKSADIDLTE